MEKHRVSRLHHGRIVSIGHKKIIDTCNGNVFLLSHPKYLWDIMNALKE